MWTILLLFVAVCNAVYGQVSACLFCSDGSTPPIQDQDLTSILISAGYGDILAASGISSVTCGLVPVLLPLIPGGITESQCTDLQTSAGPLCGCSIPSALNESSTLLPSLAPTVVSSECSVCTSGIDPTFSQQNVSDLIISFGISAYFEDAETLLTCEVLQMTPIVIDDDQCDLLQRDLINRCGCKRTQDSSNSTAEATYPSLELSQPSSAPSLVSEEDSTQQSQQLTCSLCWDGSRPSRPDRNITSMLFDNSFAREIIGSLGVAQVTCDQVYSLLPFIGADDISTSDCNSIQSGLGGVCGCPPKPSGCVFCPNEVIEDPDAPYGFSRYYLNTLLTCNETADILLQVDETEDICFLGHLTNYVCGCNGGSRSYFGTESDGQRAALAWIPRLSGGLSLLGSIYIIYDVVKRLRSGEQNQRQSRSGRAGGIKSRPVFDALVLSMAAFDVLTSICWMLSTAPIPKYDQFGSSTGVYGAIGNEKTCQAQAFVFQLSAIASMFYNVTLSIYYMMVIVYGLRETQMQKYAPYLLVPPIVIALAMAFAGLSLYQPIDLMCSIAPPPEASSWWPIIGFTLFPVAFCLLGASFLMIIIYISVRKKLFATQKYDFTRIVRHASPSRFLHSESKLSQDIKLSSTSGDIARPSQALCLSVHSTRSSDPTANAGHRELTGQEKMLRTVFWQSFFYLAAFMVSYPAWFISNIMGENTSYRFWIAVVVLTPLQGFLNFLVHVRPRYVQYLEQRNKQKGDSNWRKFRTFIRWDSSQTEALTLPRRTEQGRNTLSSTSCSKSAVFKASNESRCSSEMHLSFAEQEIDINDVSLDERSSKIQELDETNLKSAAFDCIYTQTEKWESEKIEL
jgi:hypothetical protein